MHKEPDQESEKKESEPDREDSDQQDEEDEEDEAENKENMQSANRENMTSNVLPLLLRNKSRKSCSWPLGKPKAPSTNSSTTIK